MKLRNWINVLAGAVMALVPVMALAQEVTAPVPMPRPADRMPNGASQRAATPSPTEQQVVATAPAVAAPATATEAVAAIATKKQRVTLTAQITANGMNIPDGRVR